MNPEVRDALGFGGGVISLRQHPRLADPIEHLRRTGTLVAVLPGVYVPHDLVGDWRVLVHAAHVWDPTITIVGEAAAALTFWPELSPRLIELAGRRCRARTPHYSIGRRRIPTDLVAQIGGIEVAVPDLTAIDLSTTHGGDVIDRALRSRMATLAGMHRALALTTQRSGNVDRRALLLDSRDEPWSEAERLAHRHLRGARITGWRTNVRTVLEGRTYYFDIYFARERLVVEIDGKVHLSESAFETDRQRGNDLLLSELRALHFTWTMLLDGRGFVSTIERARALTS